MVMKLSQPFSIRLTPTIRATLELIQADWSERAGRKISLSSVVETILENPPPRYDLHSTVSGLLDKPRDTLLRLIEKVSASSVFSLAEWIFLAEIIETNSDGLFIKDSSEAAGLWSTLYDAITALIELTSPRSAMLPYVAANFGSNLGRSYDDHSEIDDDYKSTVSKLVQSKKTKFLSNDTFFKDDTVTKVFNTLVRNSSNSVEFQDENLDRFLNIYKIPLICIAIRSTIGSGNEPIINYEYNSRFPSHTFEQSNVIVRSTMHQNGDFTTYLSKIDNNDNLSGNSYYTISGYGEIRELIELLEDFENKDFKESQRFQLFIVNGDNNMFDLRWKFFGHGWNISKDTKSIIRAGLIDTISKKEWAEPISKLQMAYGWPK
jgi:hypothetical protein